MSDAVVGVDLSASLFPHERRSLEQSGKDAKQYFALDLMGPELALGDVDAHGNVSLHVVVKVPAGTLKGFGTTGLLSASGKPQVPDLSNKFAFAPNVRFVMDVDALTDNAKEVYAKNMEAQKRRHALAQGLVQAEGKSA